MCVGMLKMGRDDVGAGKSGSEEVLSTLSSPY